MTATDPDDTRPESPAQTHTILLVDDNPGDARLVEEAFSAAVADGLHVVQTGEDALDFVHQRGEYAEAPQPDLVLLDWHLPGIEGVDVLADLNSDPEYNHIPVIVMTGSHSEREVRNSYRQNANACIAKRADPDELESILRAVEDFWLSAARLPRTDERG